MLVFADFQFSVWSLEAMTYSFDFEKSSLICRTVLSVKVRVKSCCSIQGTRTRPVPHEAVGAGSGMVEADAVRMSGNRQGRSGHELQEEVVEPRG
ncbi:hypothetical protein HPP92_023581 [Vanilla planifolia]|uniref:Uncharacterized protein n=1 Tax=Vanilla planifolia TaxID=51239 RepID=A0A835UCZ5_VANPL|nr:hypothetical protein HPP92_023581 [Vanilla planifolia]